MTDHPAPSRDAAYFQAIYDTSPDPWDFRTSAYEHQKYKATLAALAHRSFANALEVGCSIGVLTKRLGPRCASLLAVDVVETALAAARTNCQDMPHIRFAQRRVPHQWPAGQTFDLIVFSEVLYFLSAADIRLVADLACASLSRTGVIMLVNYTERMDEPCGGNQAAEIFISTASAKLTHAHHARQPKFRIDRLEPR